MLGSSALDRAATGIGTRTRVCVCGVCGVWCVCVCVVCVCVCGVCVCGVCVRVCVVFGV